MRELKFRVWLNALNGVGKQYYYSYDVTQWGQQYVNKAWGSARMGNPVELYTGLKDKNGKEIYEGDIVDYDDDGECIGVVEYDAPEFYLNADATNWARMFLKGAPHQRVIGNIHENPELCGEEEE